VRRAAIHADGGFFMRHHVMRHHVMRHHVHHGALTGTRRHVKETSMKETSMKETSMKETSMPILPYRGVWPRIAEDAFIAPSTVIAGDVTVESGANIWFGAVLRGDAAPIVIGPRTNVQDNCVLHGDEGAPCTLGAECTLGHGAVVHGATLEDGVLVGMHATVLNSATLGEGCMVAAGALVPEGKRFEPGQLIVGVPGKAVRPVSDAERERARSGVAHYLAYAREYAAVLRAQSAEPET
jgi:carbonic anhydrase/acetyltransferase-like protein (isoleucine patch superfamily)